MFSPLESVRLEYGVETVNRSRVNRFGGIDHVADARQVQLRLLLHSQELSSRQAVRKVRRLNSVVTHIVPSSTTPGEENICV